MQKITYANPVLIFCQNKNNKKTDMRKIVSFVSALVIIAMQKYGKSFKLATNFLKSSTIICEKCFVTHEPAILEPVRQ